MKKHTKTIFIFSIALLAYGFLAREINLYFFWESKSIGLFILFIGLLFYLLDIIKSRKLLGKKTLWPKIGVGAIILGILGGTIALITINNSDACKAAKEYLKNDSHLIEEIGNIKSFGMVTTASIETVNRNGVENGQAIIIFVVKGNKKYKDVTVHLRKANNSSWTVISIE